MNREKSEVRSQKSEVGGQGPEIRHSGLSIQYSVLSTPRAASRRQFSICNLHFAFCNSPSRRGRSGLSLVEVLASIGVLSVGILGLAALLPVGQVTIFEAIKADRAGACGRAAMREVVVRRMLDYHTWYDPYQGKFVYDPSYNGGSN